MGECTGEQALVFAAYGNKLPCQCDAGVEMRVWAELDDHAGVEGEEPAVDVLGCVVNGNGCELFAGNRIESRGGGFGVGSGADAAARLAMWVVWHDRSRYSALIAEETCVIHASVSASEFAVSPSPSVAFGAASLSRARLSSTGVCELVQNG